MTRPRLPELPRAKALDALPGDTPGAAGISEEKLAGAPTMRSMKDTVGLPAGRAAIRQVEKDAIRLFGQILAELPSDGATVRQLAQIQAWHCALAAYFTAQAAAHGLSTPEAKGFLEESLKQSQRAERLAVTTLDLATKHAQRKPKDTDPHTAFTNAIRDTPPS